MDTNTRAWGVETAEAPKGKHAAASGKTGLRRRPLWGQGVSLFIWLWLPVLSLLGGIRIMSAYTDISIRQLTQDPTTVLEAPFYIGFVSNIGVLLWAAAAAICLFIPIFLPRFVSYPWRFFLLASGLLTGLLLFDDFFLLHDEILPLYFGISGKVYGIGYVLLIVLYLFRFQPLIRRSKYGLLLIALGFFAFSATVDVLHSLVDNELDKSQLLLLEDGAKLMGITHWLAYFASVARTVCARLRLAPKPQTSPDEWPASISVIQPPPG